MVKSVFTFYVCTPIAITVFGLLLLFQNEPATTIRKPQPKPKLYTKYILFWLPMFSDLTFSFKTLGYEPFKTCKYKNCFTTNNKSLLPVSSFDAIVFHGPEYGEGHGKPTERSKHQRYIFATMESLASSKPFLRPFDGFYNWTMTYRLDSDIPFLYGEVIKGPTNYTLPTISQLKKRKLAAWIVSHCDTLNRREKLYRLLNKYIKIDVYGNCGNLTCPTDATSGRNEDCYDFVAKRYKFYLSFENSHCKDYVTEKLYRALKRDVVPIAYGKADYDRVAPPRSVIVADRFKSVKELIKLIMYLDGKTKEYLKYFDWKKNYRITESHDSAACRLCEMLNTHQPVKVYRDMDGWFLGENLTYCKNGFNLPYML